MARSTIPGVTGGARLFVASFGNNTVDVVDIPDLTMPRGVSLVGHIGPGVHRPLGLDIPGAAR